MVLIIINYIKSFVSIYTMFKKRGFVVSQSMLYAFGVITIILIVFWGYKSMTSFSKAKDTAELNKFRLKILNDIEVLSMKKGTIKEFQYFLPLGYDYLCVFDLEHSENLNSTIMTYYPQLKEGVEAGESNIFIVGRNKFYSFKSDLVAVGKYPYYACKQIFKDSLTLSAKGAVIDGEIATQIISSTISKKKLKELGSDVVFNTLSNSYSFNSNFTLYSSDGAGFGYEYIFIPQGTIATLPGNNDTIFIELKGRGGNSEKYVEGPNGTTFIPPIIIGIKPIDEECNPASYYSTGYNFLGCDEKGYATFEISKFG